MQVGKLRHREIKLLGSMATQPYMLYCLSEVGTKGRMRGREEGRKRALSTWVAPAQPVRQSSYKCHQLTLNVPQVPSIIQNTLETQIWASKNGHFTEGAFLLRNSQGNVGAGTMGSQRLWKNRFQPGRRGWQWLILVE